MEKWYQLKAFGDTTKIAATSHNVSVNYKLKKITLYSGSCNSLTSVFQDTASDVNDTILNINAYGLTSGTTYYIKVSTSQILCPSCVNPTPEYILCLSNVIPPCLPNNGCYDAANCSVVCNGDFETYYVCPTGFNQFSLACSWHIPNFSTPDYFNSCATGSNPANSPDVPNNTVGFQNSYGGGQGYGGIYVYADAGNINNANAREYMYQKLLRNLDTAITYRVRFFTSLANKSKYAAGAIGAYFTDTFNLSPNSNMLTHNPQVFNNTNNYLTDTANWTIVQGDYKPTTVGQHYMIIGNFKNDAVTAPIVVNNTTNYVEPNSGCRYAYYYIDSVSVRPLPPTIKNFPLTVCMNNTDTIKTYGSSAGATYSWNFGDGDSTAGVGSTAIPGNTNGGRTSGIFKNPMHRYALPGNYVVTLKITSSTNCTMIVKHTITVIPSTANYNTNCCSNGVTYTMDANATGPFPKIFDPLNNPQVWSTNKKIRGTIIVAGNAALTIQNCTIEFDPASKIIVEAGGVLLIDGAILTGIKSPCYTMWQGIEVWGDPTKSQTAIADPNTGRLYQGKVTMKNGSAIQNAHFGVTLGKPLFNANGFDLNYSGGILFTHLITGSLVNFYNCAIGVRIAKYGYPNTSKIQNCEFNGAALLDPGYKSSNSYYTYPIPANNLFYASANATCRASIHLSVWDNRIIPPIQSVEFINGETGILSYDSRYTVRSLALLFNSSYTTGFGDLADGIKAYNTYSSFSNTLSVLHTAFDRKIQKNCIYIDAGLYSTINYTNAFNKNSDPQANFTYGIYLRNASGYNILDNSFIRFPIGIFAGNSYPYGGLIGYSTSGNIFTRNNRSVLSIGDNSKLILRCNATNNSAPSEYIRNWQNQAGSPLANQGSYSATDETQPAGNRFNTSQNTIRKEIVSLTPYFYFAHSSPSEFVPVDAGINITIDATSIASTSVSNSCTPSSGNPSQKIAEMDSLQNQIDSLKTVHSDFSGIIENERTEDLIDLINTDITATKLQSNLVDNSPLSDEVLIAFLTRTYTTPDTVVYNAMVLNLPVSDAVLPYLNAKLATLPSQYSTPLAVMQVINPVPFFTLTGLDRKMASLDLSRQQNLNSVVEYYIEQDTVELVAGLLEAETTTAASMQLISYYIGIGQLNTAQDKLDNLPSDNALLTSFKSVSQILIDLQSGGKTVFDMDNVQEDEIRSIASMTPMNMAISNAQAILKLVFGEEPDLAADTTSGDSRLNGGNSITLPLQQGEQYVSQNAPNPASGLTTINYYVPEGSISAQMNIYDVTGRIIKTYKLVPGKDVLEVNTSDLTNGVYMYGLVVDGVLVQNKKFIVTKE